MQVKGVSSQLFKILSDGEWHSIGELIAVFASSWPPERVMRRAKNDLKSWLILLEEDPQRVIDSGRRHILFDILRNLRVRRHVIEKIEKKKEGRRTVAVRMLVKPVIKSDCEKDREEFTKER